MSVRYEELEPLVRAVLEHIIVSSERTAPEILSVLFPKVSKSTYYRYYKKAEDKLRELGLLDRQNNPTPLAYEILPSSVSQRLLMEMRREINKLADLSYENEDKIGQLESQYGELRKELDLRIRERDTVAAQLESIDPIFRLLEWLRALDVDINWMTVMVALNSVELAIKKKLDQLAVDVPEKPTFSDLHDLLQQALKQKENRTLSPSFLRPRDLYDMRSKIDHWGHKYPKIERGEAEFIARQATKFIEEIFQRPQR